MNITQTIFVFSSYRLEAAAGVAQSI